jgi:hypothetical protein
MVIKNMRIFDMEKINVILILEILGKPKEHIIQTLSDIIDKLGKEKDVKLGKKNIVEAKKLEGKDAKGEIFTSFAEVEIETSLQQLMLICLAYMPSHIEIVYPEEMKIRNLDMNMFFTELLRRLHQYDELARALMIEREIIARQVQEGKIKVERVDSAEKKKILRKVKKKEVGKISKRKRKN